jgi:hypothetical protein
MKTWQWVLLAGAAYYFWKRNQASAVVAPGVAGLGAEIPFGLHAPILRQGGAFFPQVLHAGIQNNMPETWLPDVQTQPMTWPESQSRQGYVNSSGQFIVPSY